MRVKMGHVIRLDQIKAPKNKTGGVQGIQELKFSGLAVLYPPGEREIL